jgi:hypothetical protein
MDGGHITVVELEPNHSDVATIHFTIQRIYVIPMTANRTIVQQVPETCRDLEINPR